MNKFNGYGKIFARIYDGEGLKLISDENFRLMSACEEQNDCESNEKQIFHAEDLLGVILRL